MNPLKFSLMMMKSSINYLYQSPWQALAKSFPQSELQHVARSTKYYCCTPVDVYTLRCMYLTITLLFLTSFIWSACCMCKMSRHHSQLAVQEVISRVEGDC